MEFVEFYQATSPRTLRYAYGLTGDLAQAQDVVQEAYVRAWQRWRKLRGYDDAEAWLRLVVSRLVFDWWRHLRVRRTAALTPPAPVGGPSEESVLVVAALKKLPDRQRKALAMHYLLDMPVAQIAADMEVSEGTVKSWLSRGRASLAVLLKEELAGVQLPGAGAVEDLAERRRRTRVGMTVTAAGLAVIAVIVLVSAIAGRSRTMPPPSTVAPTGSPMAFSPLRSVGSVALPGNVDQVAIKDGRVFTASYTAGSTTIRGYDLSTLSPAWPAVTLPQRVESSPWLVIRPDAVALIADDKTSIIDPVSGALLWQRAGAAGDVHDTVFFPGIAVFVDHDAGAATGVDLVTGNELWRIVGAADQVFGMMQPADLALPDDGPGWIPPGYADGPLFLADAHGTVTEYAVATGEATGRAWRGIPDAGGYLAYNGDLYINNAREAYKVHLADGKQTRIYAGGGIGGMSPCGATDICLIDNTEEQRCLVVAIHNGKVKWSVREDQALSMGPVGRALRVSTGQNGTNVLLDEQGREVVRLTGLTTLMRLDAGNMMAYKIPEAGHEGPLTGITAAGAHQTPLGSLKLSPGMPPAADGSTVVYAADGKLTVYRIAY